MTSAGRAARRPSTSIATVAEPSIPSQYRLRPGAAQIGVTASPTIVTAMCVAATAVAKPSSASTIDGTERTRAAHEETDERERGERCDEHGEHPRAGGTGKSDQGQEVVPAREAAVGRADRELRAVRWAR